MKLKVAVILTVDEVKNHIRPILGDMIRTQVSDALKGCEESKKSILNSLEFSRWTPTELADFWREICSSTFFENNLSGEIAIMEVNKWDTIWLANRE